MRRAVAWCLASALVQAAVLAEDTPPKPEVKALSGMSILGNQEAPKSLVIVPWKSSEIGSGIDLSKGVDDRPVPVDRDVFARQLGYYEIRSSGAKK